MTEITNSATNRNLRAQRWAGLFILLTMVWSLAMLIQERQFDKGDGKVVEQCGSPVACLELLKSAATVQALINGGDSAVNLATLRYNTYMDFVFIILYCAAFAFLARTYRGNRVLAGFTTVLVIVAGVFDYWENFRMLHELKDVSRLEDPYVATTSLVSSVKWIALAVLLCCLGLIFLRAIQRDPSRRITLGFIAALFPLSGIFIIVGLLHLPVIGLWVPPFALAFLLSLFLFAPLRSGPNNL